MHSSNLEENETKINIQYKTNNNNNLDIEKLLEQKRKNKILSTSKPNSDNKDGDKLLKLLMSKRKQNLEESNNQNENIDNKNSEKKDDIIDNLITKRLQEKLKSKNLTLENNQNKSLLVAQTKENNKDLF